MGHPATASTSRRRNCFARPPAAPRPRRPGRPASCFRRTAKTCRRAVENPLFKKIREDGAKRELPLIVETIRKFADGGVSIKGKKLYKNGVLLEHPYDLSEEVDRAIGEK